MTKRYVCTAVYEIQPGDTLSAIARSHNVSTDLLMRANKITNPYNIQPGEKLCIPGIPDDNPTVCEKFHIVKEGDTLYLIAKQHRITLDSLMTANPNIDPYNLTIGVRLCIPV